MVHRPPIADAASLAEAIARLPEVQRVTLVRTETRAAIAARPRSARASASSLVGTTGGRGRQHLDHVSGSSLPSAPDAGEPPPLVVSPRLAAELQLEPGSRCSSGCSSRRGVRAAARHRARRRHRAVRVRSRRRRTPWPRRWRGLPRRDGTPAKRRGGNGAGLVATRRGSGRGRGDRAPPAGSARPLERSGHGAVQPERVQLLPADLDGAVVDDARLCVPAHRHAADHVGQPAAGRSRGAAGARLPAAADCREPAVGIGAARRRRRRCGAAGRRTAGHRARSHPAPDARRARRGCTSSSSSRGRVVLHAVAAVASPACWPRCIRSGSRRGCRLPRRCGERFCRDRDGHADHRGARPDAIVRDAGRAR